MSVRTAELLAAVVLALASIALMAKSAELNIGWVKDRGPGAGAWPFWLSAAMLLCCLVTILRWVARVTPESRSLAPYLERDALAVVGASALALFGLLLVTQFAGIYIALPLFLLGYVRLIGGHRWAVALSIAILFPLGIFALFEWALQIPLPKAFTDAAFYPVYDLMYARDAGEALRALGAPIVALPLVAGLAVIAFWALRWLRGRGGRAGEG